VLVGRSGSGQDVEWVLGELSSASTRGCYWFLCCGSSVVLVHVRSPLYSLYAA
jgi:hypothetical protein